MEEKNADKQGVAVFTSLTNQTSATQLAMAIDNLPPFARVSARGGGQILSSGYYVYEQYF